MNRESIAHSQTTQSGLHVPASKEVAGYVLHETIGQGGIGTVHRATHLETGDEVAVKIGRPAGGLEKELGAMFRREAEILSELSHPNIVRILDAGSSTENASYYAMERVDGRDLKRTNSENPLGWEDFQKVILQCFDALAYVHSQGIAHGDVKPSNVILSPDGAVTLIDFGLAERVDDRTCDNAPQCNTIFGSLNHGAPEVFSEDHAIDFRTDVYGMGVMIYELLTGKVPRSMFLEVSQRISYEGSLKPLLLKALAYDAEDRYQTIDEMKEDFLRLTGA